MKTFVVGDIHGAHRALIQCLQRSHFDYANDRLIALGDVCDGWPEVRQCIDELLKIKHLDYILGNHDLWAIRWTEEGFQEPVWIEQGGRNTLVSYDYAPLPPEHLNFLKQAQRYLQVNDKLFLHAGFDPRKMLSEQSAETFIWDRDFILAARARHQAEPQYNFGLFNEIFLGHTTTQALAQTSQPLKYCNVWDVDTGAGWSGKLTIMDIKTKEFWQSDPVPQLYPYIKGRG